ncbi:MAG: protein-methionine-sulfoxide reductase catalytic subunit MsrP [Nitrospinaceae bacterium]
MTWIRIPRPWEVSGREVTPEAVFHGRRDFLKKMGILGAGVAALAAAPSLAGLSRAFAQRSAAPVNPNSITPESLTGRFNNFYEFSADKGKVWRQARDLKTAGWTVRVLGHVARPGELDVSQLIRGWSLEERVYRLRCVETWSAVIPWRGVPFKELVKRVDPLSSARYVKLRTFLDPDTATGQHERFWEPWPYTEGLTMAEAMHDLTFLAEGMYGNGLNPQNGAPLRLVVPWKYGFKSIKSIASIEFTDRMPETFWTTISPLEYDFSANVLPQTPYARWAQQYERPLGREGLTPTLPYNGYADAVAGLYP